MAKDSGVEMIVEWRNKMTGNWKLRVTRAITQTQSNIPIIDLSAVAQGGITAYELRFMGSSPNQTAWTNSGAHSPTQH